MPGGHRTLGSWVALYYGTGCEGEFRGRGVGCGGEGSKKGKRIRVYMRGRSFYARETIFKVSRWVHHVQECSGIAGVDVHVYEICICYIKRVDTYIVDG